MQDAVVELSRLLPEIHHTFEIRVRSRFHCPQPIVLQIFKPLRKLVSFEAATYAGFGS